MGDSERFHELLDALGASLVVSTRRRGRLLLVHAGRERPEPEVTSHRFGSPLGVAARPGVLAVATRTQVWFLRSVLDATHPADARYLALRTHHTGDIRAEDLAWGGATLWLVNRRFSCLCTLNDEYSFVPRWRPPFVSALAPEDRCGLNGLAIVDGVPRYATTLGESDTPGGWRSSSTPNGCLMDLAGNETVLRGLSRPRCPRVHDGRVWLLESGRRRLVTADPAGGAIEAVAEFPGAPRGLAMHGSLAFVGLTPSTPEPCAVAVVDLPSGLVVARLGLDANVRNVRDVQLLPGVRRPALSGPNPGPDNPGADWRIPGPDTTAGLAELRRFPRLSQFLM